MKKTLPLFVLVMLSIGFTQAQDLENSLLWEVSGNGLEQASYIFGTIHMTCDASLDNNVKTPRDKTSLLELELDIDDPAMNATMMSNIAMKDNQNIKDLLSVEEYATLDTFTKANFGAPLATFATFKPFLSISNDIHQVLRLSRSIL